MFRWASPHKYGQFYEPEPRASTKSPDKACPSPDIRVTEEICTKPATVTAASTARAVWTHLYIHISHISSECRRLLISAYIYNSLPLLIQVCKFQFHVCAVLINCYCKPGNSKISGFRHFMITSFNFTVSKFRDWSRRIGMRPREWCFSFLQSPAIAQITLSSV